LEHDEIRSYIERLVGNGGDDLARVYKESVELRKYGVFPIDAPCGRFLELLTRIRSPKSILEIGPGIGYSALWILRGASSTTTLDVIEVDPNTAHIFETVMARQNCRNEIKVHRGPALQVLARMKKIFDFIFIDADKNEYPDYLRHSLRMTQPGSVILADDIYKFWNETSVRQKQSDGQGVRGYTEMIFKDKRLSSLVIPVGDGLAISFRIE
jgi:predicted O-methyltransferase YrrM